MACYLPVVSNYAFLIWHSPHGIYVPREHRDSIINCLTHDETMNKHKGIAIYGYATNDPLIVLVR